MARPSRCSSTTARLRVEQCRPSVDCAELLWDEKSWLFCGLIAEASAPPPCMGSSSQPKMNGLDPQAWLADVLARIAAHPVASAR